MHSDIDDAIMQVQTEEGKVRCVGFRMCVVPVGGDGRLEPDATGTIPTVPLYLCCLTTYVVWYGMHACIYTGSASRRPTTTTATCVANTPVLYRKQLYHHVTYSPTD
jgi:hypothetical protein